MCTISTGNNSPGTVRTGQSEKNLDTFPPSRVADVIKTFKFE